MDNIKPNHIDSVFKNNHDMIIMEKMSLTWKFVKYRILSL